MTMLYRTLRPFEGGTALMYKHHLREMESDFTKAALNRRSWLEEGAKDEDISGERLTEISSELTECEAMLATIRLALRTLISTDDTHRTVNLMSQLVHPPQVGSIRERAQQHMLATILADIGSLNCKALVEKEKKDAND